MELKGKLIQERSSLVNPRRRGEKLITQSKSQKVSEKFCNWIASEKFCNWIIMRRSVNLRSE